MRPMGMARAVPPQDLEGEGSIEYAAEGTDVLVLAGRRGRWGISQECVGEAHVLRVSDVLTTERLGNESLFWCFSRW